MQQHNASARPAYRLIGTPDAGRLSPCLGLGLRRRSLLGRGSCIHIPARLCLSPPTTYLHCGVTGSPCAASQVCCRACVRCFSCLAFSDGSACCRGRSMLSSSSGAEAGVAATPLLPPSAVCFDACPSFSCCSSTLLLLAAAAAGVGPWPAAAGVPARGGSAAARGAACGVVPPAPTSAVLPDSSATQMQTYTTHLLASALSYGAEKKAEGKRKAMHRPVRLCIWFS
jgi:hypothetical protein